MREPIKRNTKQPIPVEWWIDERGAKFRVLATGEETVNVIDEFGVRRVVNRLMWERDMRRAS